MGVYELKVTVASVFNETGPNQRLQSLIVRTTLRVTPGELLCRSYETVASILSAAIQDVLISVALLTNGSFFRLLALDYRKVLPLTRGIPFHTFMILVRRVGIVFFVSRPPPYRKHVHRETASYEGRRLDSCRVFDSLCRWTHRLYRYDTLPY